MIGGDFSASIGRDSTGLGMCGRYELGRGNEGGRELVECCNENELAYAKSCEKI